MLCNLLVATRVIESLYSVRCVSYGRKRQNMNAEKERVMMLREFLKDRSPTKYMKILEMCRLIEERVDAGAAERSSWLIPEERQIVKTVLTDTSWQHLRG